MQKIPIRNPFPGADAFFVAATGSTQDEAKALALAGLAPGSLVATDEQSEGRGRFPDRKWESAPGKNLLFTVYLGPRGADASLLAGLPIKVGLSLHKAVADYAAAQGLELSSPLTLKWPNDLMIGDRKTAGILCESTSAGIFAGVGLNCNQDSFPPEIESRATSLRVELSRDVERWKLLELFLQSLIRALSDDLWREEAVKRLWRHGESVAFLAGLESRSGQGESVRGILEGIDANGSLLIREEAGGLLSFPAGELTAAPPPY